jgi:hypothetical protein
MLFVGESRKAPTVQETGRHRFVLDVADCVRNMRRRFAFLLRTNRRCARPALKIMVDRPNETASAIAFDDFLNESITFEFGTSAERICRER